MAWRMDIAADSRRNTSDKRHPCYAFQAGECNRGDACRFGHFLPNHAGGKQPCLAWAGGGCHKGAACKFSHDGIPGQGTACIVRRSPHARGNYDGSRGPPVGICFQYNEEGYCVKGDACAFRHVRGLDEETDDERAARQARAARAEQQRVAQEWARREAERLRAV